MARTTESATLRFVAAGRSAYLILLKPQGSTAFRAGQGYHDTVNFTGFPGSSRRIPGRAPTA